MIVVLGWFRRVSYVAAKTCELKRPVIRNKVSTIQTTNEKRFRVPCVSILDLPRQTKERWKVNYCTSTDISRFAVTVLLAPGAAVV